MERIKARITRRGTKVLNKPSLASVIVEMDVEPWKQQHGVYMAHHIYKNGQRIGGIFCSHDDDGVRRWNKLKA